MTDIGEKAAPAAERRRTGVKATGHDIIVIGASAGGVEGVVEISRALPADLPASIFVVLHIPPTARSLLPEILSRTGKLPAGHVRDGQPIERSSIYVAPPDHHLLIKDGQMRTVRGPKENGHRPAIDPLFRTASAAYGRRVVGVILSGNLDDGTAGLAEVKRMGGVALVQDPSETPYPGMPRSAIKNVAVDDVLSLQEIAEAVVQLARSPLEEAVVMGPGEGFKAVRDPAEMDLEAILRKEVPATLSGLGCPFCGGPLKEQNEGDFIRFRCKIGHAYTMESLISEHTEAVERALSAGLLALTERALLARRMCERAERRGSRKAAENYAIQASSAEEDAALLQTLLQERKWG